MEGRTNETLFPAASIRSPLFPKLHTGYSLRAKSAPVLHYLMVTLFVIVTGLPSKAGTSALRNAEAMQPPSGVPANGGFSTFADVTCPLGAKTTFTVAVPFGPSGCLQSSAVCADADNAAIAAPLSNVRPSSPVPVARDEIDQIDMAMIWAMDRSWMGFVVVMGLTR